jgi:hypothetical protein
MQDECICSKLKKTMEGVTRSARLAWQFLPSRPVLTLGLASIARAPSASPSAAPAAASAAVALVTLVTLAAVEAHSRRSPAGNRAGSAPGLVRMLRRSVIPVPRLSGAGSGTVVTCLVHPVPWVPGPVPGKITLMAESRI